MCYTVLLVTVLCYCCECILCTGYYAYHCLHLLLWEPSHNILVLSMMMSTVVMPHSWWVVTTSMNLSSTIPLILYIVQQNMLFRKLKEVHLHNHAHLVSFIISLYSWCRKSGHLDNISRHLWLFLRCLKYTAGSTVL